MRAAAASQEQLTPGNLDRNRNEVLGAIQLKVVHLHRNRDVGDRVFQQQRILELPLLVRCREFCEGLVGEVTLAVRQLGGQRPGQRNAHAMESAIRRAMRAVIPDEVVAGQAVGGIDDTARKIVVVEERLSPRVLRQRIKGVLGSLEVRSRRIRQLTRKHPDAAGRRFRRVAERRLRDEAARVDRVDRNVGANRSVDRGS